MASSVFQSDAYTEAIAVQITFFEPLGRLSPYRNSLTVLKPLDLLRYAIGATRNMPAAGELIVTGRQHSKLPKVND